tara:strand:+ start:773 stop:1012 length:240 start_codon:yes stop_codon:yes gene_type:complete
MSKIYIKNRTEEEEKELEKRIFKNHLINLNRLNDKIKHEGLKDLLILKNLIEINLEGFSKNEIRLMKKDLKYNYLKQEV